MAAEQTPATSTPPAPQVAKPADPRDSLLEQYELGDTSLTGDLEPPPESPPAPETPALPARGDDGRFLPSPQHPRSLVRQARELGISDEDVRATPTAALDEMVETLAAQRADHARQNTISQAAQATPSPGAPAPDGVVPPPPGDFDWGSAEDGRKYTGEDYAPAVQNAVKRLFELEKRIAAMEPAVRYAAGRVHAGEQQSLAAAFDEVFGERPDVFGKGRGHELDQKGADYDRRAKMIRLVEQDRSAAHPAAKLKKVIASLYPEPTAAPAAAPEPAANGAQPWATTTARPTNRAGAAEPPGDKKAVQTATRIMREQGYETDLESFPD